MGPHLKYNYNTDVKLKEAMEAIRHGASFTIAHRMSGISPMTLRKYYDKYIAEYGLIPITETVRKTDINVKPDFHRVFTYDQEIAFKEILIDFEDLFYGLSEKELCILAYQMAALNDSKMPIDWQYGMAAVDWILNFKSRHRDLNIEKPVCGYKKTRSIVYEKKNVNKFYARLEKHLQDNGLLSNSSRIFSLDEIYTSPYPVIRKDKRSKGDLITTCCIVCSDGTSLPPVIILPHAFTNSCSLPGAMTLTVSYGRMTAEFFPEVMQHFINHSKTSPENPSALILDIDSCHLSIATLNLAKTNGVHLVTYHPHASKKLQPLEVGLLDLFQTYYYECLDKIYAQNEIIDRTSVDISKVVGEAFEKAITPENITEAFKKCGIQPFDTDLLTDSDYKASLSADQACFDCKSRNMANQRHAIQSPGTVGVSAEIAGEESNDGQDEASEDSTDPGDSRQTWKSKEPDKSSDSKMPRGDKGAELDKLKRRMIRTVARLLKEKKPEDELWKELKKETGGNCRQLWERMRSLTMKKLKRLFDADDRVDLVPNVARMTLTDWLMYDLVLVHEKIDVIHRNESSNSPSKVLSNLFSLVQMFSIEGRSGNDLANAWTAATVHYNSKGHQCSPMLMQRRWYQIKELTRHKMYKFWFNYRGNQRLLAHANQDPPTELQKAIALRYPEIITHTFPEWQERIDTRLVIMPEEFEIKMRKRSLIKPTDENAPDVVIVESKVDTITLPDSDSEYSDDENSRGLNVTALNANEKSNADEDAMQTPIIVQVKTEPQDEHNENTYEASYPQDEETDRFHDEIERLKLEEEKILSDDDNSRDVATPNQVENQEDLPLTTNITETIDIDKETPVEQEMSKTVATGETELRTVENNADIGSQDSILIDDDDEDMNPVQQLSPIQQNTQETDGTENKVIDITSPNAKQNTKDYSHETDGVVIVESDAPISSLENQDNDESIIHNEYASTEEVLPIITGIASGSQVVAKLEYIAEMQSENYIANENDVVPTDLMDQPKMEIDTDMPHETADNMEVVDLQDSSDNPGDENIPNIEPVQNKQDSQHLDVADEVIDLVNLADGIEFADDGIEYDDEDGQNKEGIDETPNMPGGENNEDEKEIPPKFDLKLLMNPVVYSTKLDEMTVYKSRCLFNTIVEKELIDKIILESKPISSKSINNVIPETKSRNEHENTIINPVSYKHNENVNFNENKICAIQGANENQYATEEHTFEADDDLFHNNAADEYESDDSVELKKVKLSSNILQKPRTLSYNPIQLCKNPDFNTRLKRLTVGFFTSSRNRVLLSACKPMTVDLSKAFESKLVNGTMYLTPSDPAVKIEKDVNITQSLASIMPSANPVQSLINTTDVDRILQEELKKRVLERNKTINLPNISVVRQINQQLLMAEVAPIMAVIDKPVSATPPDILTNADSLKNTTSDVNNDINSLRINNDFKPDEPSSKPRENFENSNETEKKPNENPTNEANEIQPMVDKNKSKHGKRKIVQNMPNWITKHYYDIKDNSDLLLTIDTLYKMLNALDPCQEYASKFNSKNKSKSKSSDIDKSKQQKELTDPKPKAINVSKLNSDIFTPKRQRNRQSCCWAKSKIKKLTTTSPGYIRLNKHKCQPGNCTCCCSIGLKKLELEMEHMRTSKAVDSLSEVIEGVVQQSRDSINTSRAVHIVNVDANVNTDPQPRMRRDIGLQANLQEGEIVHIVDNTLNTTKNVDPDVTVVEQPGNAEVTINLDDDDENEQSKIKSPVPKIRVYSGNSVVSQPGRPRSHVSKDTSVINNPENVLMKPKSTSIKKPYRSVFPVIAQIKENQSLAEADKQNELIEKSRELLPCSCRLSVPNVAVDTSSSTLLLDGSNPCLQHNLNNSKETKIYLNRKHMSVTERPFYVGKNKILLTNIKQPKPKSSDPQLIPDPAPMTSQDTLVTSPCFTLPPGVNLVMLPNDTISYTVDPKVVLTLEQINAMPIILQAVQLKMKSSGITLPEHSSHGQQCDNNTIRTESDDVEIVNSSAETPNPENTIVDDELRLDTNNANVDLCSSLSASMQTGNEDTSTESYFIREPESQNKYNNEQTNDSSEIPLVVPYESIQKLNEHGNIIVRVMNPPELQVQNQDCADNTIEANIASEDITDNTNQNSTDESNTISEIVNTEISDTALNNASEEEVVTASIVMAQPLVQSNTDQQSGNESNTVSKKNVNLTDEVNATISTGIEVVNNAEPIAMETSELEHSTGQTSSIANASVEKSESNECNNAIEKSSTIDNLEGSAIETENSLSTKRNLFSDLMEMSGIGEEDMAPAEPAIPEPHIPLLGIPEDVLQPPVLPIDPVASLLNSDFSIPLPSLSPISQNKPLISAQIDEKIHELNPITSFAELKYACDNNGLFFKLDLSNGVIVPINVCIQKSPQVATKNAFSTKEVIDLTNEPGVSFNEEAQPTNTVIPPLAGDKEKQTTSKIMPKKLSSLMPESSSQNTNLSNLSKLLPVRLAPRTETRANTISTSKPIKLLPRPNKRRPTYSKMIAALTEESYKDAGVTKNILQKIDCTVQEKEELRKSLSNNLKPLKTLGSHKPKINILRKSSASTRRILQNLNKIEAKIDLVDSDAPMEEEYLVEDSSDDSDDEPLAKVAKKMRSNQNEDNQETYNSPLDEESQDESINQDEIVPQDVEVIDFEEAIDAIEQPLHRRSTIDTEPVPTQLLLSGEALKQPIPLNSSYVDSHENEDSQEEDCILGV